MVEAHDDRVRMVHTTALDIQDSLRNPTAMLEDSVTSVKMLYMHTPCQFSYNAFSATDTKGCWDL